jgi:thiol-disulfide isomerase/thioredoxin
MVIISCSNNKTNNTDKEETNTTTSDKDRDNTPTTSDKKVFTLESVDKSSGSKIAPNFTWDENGEKKSLSDYRGKVVFLNFWATWCGPCVREMPDLSKISEELKNEDFKMIGMNVFEKTTGKAESFLEVNPVSYTIIEGNEQLVNAYAEADGAPINGIPTTFIINKVGEIKETIVGSRDKKSFITLINKYIN